MFAALLATNAAQVVATERNQRNWSQLGGHATLRAATSVYRSIKMIFYGGGMGNPNQHATGPLPMVVAGGALSKRNRHLQLAAGTPVGNLWLTVAHQFDDPMEKFGESTGTIDLF